MFDDGPKFTLRRILFSAKYRHRRVRHTKAHVKASFEKAFVKNDDIRCPSCPLNPARVFLRIVFLM
jgi:hypothetical protein